MKLNIRLISLLLSLIMILGMFAACEGPGENTSETPDTSEQNPSTDVRTVFDLITNSETTVKVIRPENSDSDHYQVQAAVKLRKEIENTTGVRFEMEDDFIKSTESYDDSTVEILVGRTAHAQVTEAIKDLKYSDYTIKAVGNKIVVFGYTENAINRAVNTFLSILEDYITRDGNTVGVSIPAEALNVTDTHSGSKDFAAVPVFEDAKFSNIYESDLECEEIILSKVTAESYNNYIAELETSGYKKYTENEMSGSLFTTLYNDKYTLNVGFYKPYKECRIIIEPFSEKTLIGLESDNKYTAVTTTQFTMLGCEYVNSSKETVGNGLSMLYRLSDGSFVIFDGGHTTQSSTWASNLVNAIKEQAKDYATGKDIRIAAWFITHAHGDHSGMLNTQASAFKQFTVERVIACFMTDEERSKSMAAYSNTDNWSNGEGGSDDNTRAAANTMGADFIVCHVGQRFYFADTVFEILYTIESFGPEPVNALNTTTILVRAITTDAATGKSTTVMLTGDITGPALAICNKMYGADMKSDVVQVAHHGYGTWSNSEATATAYKYMKPELVFWPQGLSAYPNYTDKSYNKVLINTTDNPNFKQVFVAGWNNTKHTLPLPYNGDPNSVISIITTRS